jgi:hypothetical protein
MNDYAELEYKEGNTKFNYEDYCKAKGFNLRNEISKEQSIREFFKEKYKISENDLTDEVLTTFLDRAKIKRVQTARIINPMVIFINNQRLILHLILPELYIV